MIEFSIEKINKSIKEIQKSANTGMKFINLEAQKIKAQGQKLGFNLKIQKAKQPTSHWLLPQPHSEMTILPPGTSA